jgi:GNAT superfamily N-acetyltransferase
MREERAVELVESRDINDFIPIMRELEFGDRFLLSMLHWCGFGERSKPLAYWQVFLVRTKDEYAGVCGLYRPTGGADNIIWLGWLGLRPAFRGANIGTKSLNILEVKAKVLGANSLKVFANGRDKRVIKLYNNNGFIVEGAASIFAPEQGADCNDVVLLKFI